MITVVSEATINDKTLSKLCKIVQQGQDIPKQADKGLLRFKEILTGIDPDCNGIFLKGEQLALPVCLQETAMKLIHLGSHAGESGMAR